MDYLLGEILLLTYSGQGAFAPRGTMKCEGRLLPISKNAALYSLLGRTFGGERDKSFALPDLRGKAPAGMYYCIVTEGIYPAKD